jgi:ankyrin repeat protein
MSAFRLFAALLIAGTALPAVAQVQSESYKFLQAVRESKGDDVIAMLNKPGASVVNTRDVSTGEGALHIAIKRGDMPYVTFLLQKGADPNLRDGKNTTPMILAATLGRTDLIHLLSIARANPNLPNSSGETPLIRAVQRTDLAMVRELLADGADPDQRDFIAGKSARDYADLSTRSPAIAKLLAETPKKERRAVAGPKF